MTNRFLAEHSNEECFASSKLLKNVSSKRWELLGALFYTTVRPAAVHPTLDCLFVLFVRCNCRKNSLIEENDEVVSRLFSISPMALIDKNDGFDDTTSSFSADIHASYISDILDVHSATTEEWTTCQVADNFSPYKKAADTLRIIHVGRENHELNLQVQKFIPSDKQLHAAITDVRNTMRHCKGQRCDRAILKNLTLLNPVLDNETKWNGIYRMLKRFVQICSELVALSEDERSDILLNQSVAFKNAVGRYEKMFEDFNAVTQQLQKRNIRLCEFCLLLYSLAEGIMQGKPDRTNSLYKCELASDLIGRKATIVKDYDFENGVVKIQSGMESRLTKSGRIACAQLLLKKLISSVDDEKINEKQAQKSRE